MVVEFDYYFVNNVNDNGLATKTTQIAKILVLIWILLDFK